MDDEGFRDVGMLSCGSWDDYVCVYWQFTQIAMGYELPEKKRKKEAV